MGIIAGATLTNPLTNPTSATLPQPTHADGESPANLSQSTQPEPDASVDKLGIVSQDASDIG